MTKNPPEFSSQPLLGQQALITGGNTGIGRAIALAFAQAGADIVVNYLVDRPAAEDLAHQIAKTGRKALAIKANIADEQETTRLFKQAIAHFSTLHIVVNNAGLQADAPISDMTLKQWRSTLDVNLTGQFLCTREATREFLRRGIQDVSRSAGKIIAITSVHQKMAWAMHCNYAASKGGAYMFIKSAAIELAPHKIRVNAIAPGAVRTSINRDAWNTLAAHERLCRHIPYGRIGEPEEIAAAATWLASDAADYVTGTILLVDGGLSLTPYGGGE